MGGYRVVAASSDVSSPKRVTTKIDMLKTFAAAISGATVPLTMTDAVGENAIAVADMSLEKPKVGSSFKPTVQAGADAVEVIDISDEDAADAAENPILDGGEDKPADDEVGGPQDFAALLKSLFSGMKQGEDSSLPPREPDISDYALVIQLSGAMQHSDSARELCVAAGLDIEGEQAKLAGYEQEFRDTVTELTPILRDYLDSDKTDKSIVIVEANMLIKKASVIFQSMLQLEEPISADATQEEKVDHLFKLQARERYLASTTHSKRVHSEVMNKLDNVKQDKRKMLLDLMNVPSMFGDEQNIDEDTSYNSVATCGSTASAESPIATDPLPSDQSNHSIVKDDCMGGKSSSCAHSTTKPNHFHEMTAAIAA